MVQSGGKAKPLGQGVTLPNGIRMGYRTRMVVLTSGTRVRMQEGDMLSFNGKFMHSQVLAGPASAGAVASPHRRWRWLPPGPPRSRTGSMPRQRQAARRGGVGRQRLQHIHH